jgi:hypothetical protein
VKKLRTLRSLPILSLFSISRELIKKQWLRDASTGIDTLYPIENMWESSTMQEECVRSDISAKAIGRRRPPSENTQIVLTMLQVFANFDT